MLREVNPFIYVGLKDDYKQMAKMGISTNDVDLIICAVCIALKINRADLISAKRHRPYSWGRSIAYFLLRKTTKMSLKEIGQVFGGRDHSTVVVGIETFRDLNRVDKEFKKMVYEVKELLR